MNQVVTQPNAFDISANAFGTATDTYSSMGTGMGSLTNINDYLNPYYEQVLNAALGRMDTSYNQAIGRIGDSAVGSGAFGGDRQAVLEGVATSEYARNVGELTANVQAQSFESAADRLYRDQVTSAQGLSQLGGSYYDIGNDVMGTQASQGQQEQDLLDLILGQGQAQFQQYAQQPYQLIDMMNALLSSDARRGQGTQTQTSTPGLLDWVSLGAQTASKMLTPTG